MFNIGDYVRVMPMEVGVLYDGVLAGDHTGHEGKVSRIVNAIGESPNIFYKLECDDMLLFSKGMIASAPDPIMEKAEVIEQVSRGVSSSPTATEKKARSIDLDPEEYVEELKLFVEKYRTAFVNEGLFWEFFYEKAAELLYLRMYGVEKIKKKKEGVLSIQIMNDGKKETGVTPDNNVPRRRRTKKRNDGWSGVQHQLEQGRAA